ncbi:MAG: hypothetical protein WA830_25415 [Candidatus Sulfotelmatobacter sp.]
MRRNLTLSLLLTGLCLGKCLAQQESDRIQSRTATSLMQSRAANPAMISGKWKSNRLISSALARSVLVRPTRTAPGGDGGNSAVTGLLRKQSAAAQTILSSGASARTFTGGVRPAGTPQNGMLLNGGTKPQLMENGAVQPIGAGQTMSASGSQTIPNSSSPTTSAAQSGPTRQQAPSSPKPQVIGTRAPNPTQLCIGGIATIDGQKSGIWFSPVPGPDGTFVIQGCGFGNTAGAVYLSGLHYGSASPTGDARGVRSSPIFRDRVSFQIPPDGWSDRQILAQIDSNTGGFYDTNNVTLVVKTASGQEYQAAGMNFLAAREDQPLHLLPEPPVCAQSTGYSCVPLGVSLATVNAVAAGPVRPEVESPSLALLQPGETIAVARESAVDQFPIPANPGHSFPGGTDTYQFHFAPGFQLDPQTGVQLRHSSPDDSFCQTVGGDPSKNGNWNVNYTSTSSFQVFWEADGCWPNLTMTTGKPLDILNYASVSAYALEITVLGPRGVSPWLSGNIGSLATPPQPLPMLLK